MSTEQNKAVVRRFIESTLNDLDTAFVDELFAPDYVNHLMPGGREGFKQFLPMMRSAFPDLKMHTSIEHLIAEGDYVVARITFHYTNAKFFVPTTLEQRIHVPPHEPAVFQSRVRCIELGICLRIDGRQVQHDAYLGLGVRRANRL